MTRPVFEGCLTLSLFVSACPTVGAGLWTDSVLRGLGVGALVFVPCLVCAVAGVLVGRWSASSGAVEALRERNAVVLWLTAGSVDYRQSARRGGPAAETARVVADTLERAAQAVDAGVHHGRR